MSNHLDVTLEMLDIHGVESDNRRIQSDVDLGELFPEEVGPIGLF